MVGMQMYFPFFAFRFSYFFVFFLFAFFDFFFWVYAFLLFLKENECNKETGKGYSSGSHCLLLAAVALAVPLWLLRLLELLWICAFVGIQGVVLADSGQCSADKRALSWALTDKAREKLEKKSNR